MEKQEYNDKFRLYGLIPYQLTGIQQGIQFGHALQELNNYYRDNPEDSNFSDFKIWSEQCKTFIVLNGGTTNNREVGLDFFGTLNNHEKELELMGIKIGSFREPDLGDQLTAIVFVVPECVYNKKDYPEFWDWEPAVNYAKSVSKSHELVAFKFDNTEGVSNEIWKWYNNWCTAVMGEQKWVELRDFLRKFRLA
jgi:hypothetical protein